VLDTNVLMHDPASLFRFEEQRPLPADGHAGGARQQQEGPLGRRAQRAPGEPLPRRDRLGQGRRHRRGLADQDAQNGARSPAGACSCRPRRSTATCPATLPAGKTDNQILSVVRHLQKKDPRAA
jgi:PhoH-like ATPase